jgi:hypothetical protein
VPNLLARSGGNRERDERETDKKGSVNLRYLRHEGAGTYKQADGGISEREGPQFPGTEAARCSVCGESCLR